MKENGKENANAASPKRNYKDTVFRMLFKKKENLLSLYNALNKTAYTDIERLEVATLENAAYINYNLQRQCPFRRQWKKPLTIVLNMKCYQNFFQKTGRRR